jgi:uncharacterized protein (TIGR02147 family)
MADPDIFQYLDYRELLRDWLAAHAGRPSLRTLAGRAHCSPALLSAVINGKRDLDAGRAEVVAVAMKLDAHQTEHFVDLVALAHDPSFRRRKRAWEEALTTRRFRAAQQRVSDAAYEVLSNPEVAAVFELVRCCGWRNDPEWIARSLQPASTPAAAAAAVEALMSAGMLVRDDSGGLTVASPEWASGHDVPIAKAADRLHRKLLERAPQVLDDVPSNERQFGALTFAVSSSEVPEIKARVARFHEEIMNLVETSTATRDRVYQLNVQFYPVARPDEPAFTAKAGPTGK